MNNSDKKLFGKLMATMGVIYGKSIDQLFIQFYWNILKKYPLSDVESAMYTHVDDPDVGDFFPKPSNIKRILKGTSQSRAAIAWHEVEKQISRVGSYGIPKFKDPHISAIIPKIGGWRTLCQSSGYEISKRSSQFQQFYMQALKEAEYDAITKQAPYLTEFSNNA